MRPSTKMVLGKQECWYVLAADPGTTIVVGQKASSKAEFEELMTQGKWDALLNEIPIKKGDFFQIDPGTVHAIKGGTMVLETQQSSDVTYRLYDYDRFDEAGNPRPLHIQQSLDVIDFERPLIFDGALQVSENGVTLLEKTRITQSRTSHFLEVQKGPRTRRTRRTRRARKDCKASRFKTRQASFASLLLLARLSLKLPLPRNPLDLPHLHP